MEVHPGIFVSNIATTDWTPDPEVGGEMHVLVEGQGAYGGMSRFVNVADPKPWTLPERETILVLEGRARIEIAGGPTLDLQVGDMASLPKGALTTWHLTQPYRELWFFGRPYEMAGPSPKDFEAIRAACADYIEAWLDGDLERMRRCLHPGLAKRRSADGGSGALDLREVPTPAMLADVAQGPKSGIDRAYEVDVFDVARETASATVRSEPFVDHLHLARFGEKWLIVNALYEWRSDELRKRLQR